MDLLVYDTYFSIRVLCCSAKHDRAMELIHKVQLISSNAQNILNKICCVLNQPSNSKTNQQLKITKMTHHICKKLQMYETRQKLDNRLLSFKVYMFLVVCYNVNRTTLLL